MQIGLDVFVAILNLVHVHVIIPLTGSLAAKSPIYNVHIEIAQFPSQYRLSSCNVPYVHCILLHSSEVADAYSRITRIKTTSFPINFTLWATLLYMHSFIQSQYQYLLQCMYLSTSFIPRRVPKNQRKGFEQAWEQRYYLYSSHLL